MKNPYNFALSIVSFFFFLLFLAPAFALDATDAVENNDRPAKRAKIQKENDEIGVQEKIIRAESLGTFNVLSAELIQHIINYLIPENSQIVFVSKTFRDHAYNASYWRELCLKSKVDLSQVKENRTLYYLSFQEQLPHNLTALLLWAPHLEKLSGAQKNGKLNNDAYKLYQKAAEEGSGQIRSLGRLHMMRMQSENLIDLLPQPEMLKMLQEESDLQDALEDQLYGSNKPQLFEESSQEKIIPPTPKEYLKQQVDLLKYTCARLFNKGITEENLPIDFELEEDRYSNYLAEVWKNVQLPVQIRRNAKFLDLKNKIENLDEESEKTPEFQEIYSFLKETPLLEQDNLYRDYLRAKICVLNMIPYPPQWNEGIFNVLTKISTNEQFSLKIRTDANYLRAKMRVQLRTEKLTDDETFTLLQEVIMSPDGLNEQSVYAKILQAVLRAENRITDEKFSVKTAYKYLSEQLLDANRTEHLNSIIRYALINMLQLWSV